jgi:mannosyl-glycoprotein endo-beta-N-acetylglucosaminidase
LNNRIKSLILALVFCFTIVQFKVNAAIILNATKVNINSNKEWTVKFNRNLDEDTVNTENIVVLDKYKNTVPVSVTLGSDSKTILISPKVAGYDPGEEYELVISKNVKSSFGDTLGSDVTLKFTIDNSYSDGTSYSELPKIISNEFQYVPLMPSEKQGFILNSTGSEDVEYRIFAAEYNTYNQGEFQEITDGYVKPVDGKVIANKNLSAGTNGQKYKVIIYVKRSDSVGAHRDVNTDYDNYFVDYFRCIDSVDVTDSKYYKDVDVSLQDAVNMELKEFPVFVERSSFNNLASANQIKYYMNPKNFLDSYGKYQFLKLSYSDGVTADSLNEFLEDKGIFKGYGQAFINAAKENNISVSYLVSHAMLETGNGTSVLANGGEKNSDDEYVYGKPVYNFFGIGAVDEDPIGEGTKKAYDEGWFTPELAIEGGAKWIASGYINNPNYKQDTLYKMRWNIENPSHQYATDIAWAYKQIPNIMKVIDMMSFSNEALNFEIPKYN